MALDGCGQMCKWILIVFNVLLGLVGLLIIGGGLYLISSAEGPLDIDLKTNHFIFVVGLLVAVGAFILLVAITGGLGSCGKNKAALGVYSSLLTVLATAAIIVGIVAYNNIPQFVNHMGEFYATVFAQYMIKKDGIRAVILKLFHNTFDCCGLGGAIQTIIRETDICPQQYSVMGISISTSENCVSALVLHMQASSVLWFFLGIAGVMLVALVCSSIVWYQKSRSSASFPPFHFALSSCVPHSTTPAYTSLVPVSSPPFTTSSDADFPSHPV